MSEDRGARGLNLDLLDMLREAGGGAVGQMDLLQSLDLTRQELFADLDALRAAGYVIGKTHPYGATGYQLLDTPDRLSVHEIEQRLDTKWLGRSLTALEVCTSTNDSAKALAAAGAPHGAVVLAENQTAGRGRGGNTWYTYPGAGIYLSLVLRPGKASPAVLQVATAVAVAHTAMKKSGKPAEIRWPNDVLMSGKKLAGILAEATDTGTESAVWVVGIGFNVHHRPQDFPTEFREEATSLAIEVGSPQSRLRTLPTLLSTLEEWYDRVAAGDLAAIEAAWRPLSALLGRPVRLVHGGTPREGRVTDLSLTEGLRLETADGEEWIPAEHATAIRPLDEAS